MLTISTGRRPMRSLSRPHNGAVTSCISEKIANSNVICCGEAVNLSVKRQKRDDEAEPDEIDKDDEKQGRHRLLISRAPAQTRPIRDVGWRAPLPGLAKNTALRKSG